MERENIKQFIDGLTDVTVTVVSKSILVNNTIVDGNVYIDTNELVIETFEGTDFISIDLDRTRVDKITPFFMELLCGDLEITISK